MLGSDAAAMQCDLAGTRSNLASTAGLVTRGSLGQVTEYYGNSDMSHCIAQPTSMYIRGPTTDFTVVRICKQHLIFQPDTI